MGIQKTRAELEVEKRAALRMRIRAIDHLERIDQLSVILDQGWETTTDPITSASTVVPLDNARRQQIDSAIKAKMLLVDKVLPALKAQEITGEGGEPLGGEHQRILSTLELRNRLRAFIADMEPATPSGLLIEHSDAEGLDGEPVDTPALDPLPECLR